MIPLHAGMPLHEVIARLERDARHSSERRKELEAEVRRIARRDGPVSDFEVNTLRRYIEESGN